MLRLYEVIFIFLHVHLFLLKISKSKVVFFREDHEQKTLTVFYFFKRENSFERHFKR